jgi:hypothetical protein
MRRTSNLALKEPVSRTTTGRSRPVSARTTPQRPSPQAVKPAATGGNRVIQCLEREGVEVVYGYSGGAAMPLFDALVDSKIKFVLVRHEQGATHMADGYARATGKPGVVLVTSGPGATNCVTGLLTALMDSVPMIVLCGQTITSMLGKDAFQEADVTGITYPVVKHSYLIKDAADIPCVRRSTSRRPDGRGRCSSICRRTSLRARARRLSSTPSTCRDTTCRGARSQRCSERRRHC